MSWQRPTPPRLGHQVHVTDRREGLAVTLDGTTLRLAPGGPVEIGELRTNGLVPITLTVLADRLSYEVLDAADPPTPPDAAPAASTEPALKES